MRYVDVEAGGSNGYPCSDELGGFTTVTDDIAISLVGWDGKFGGYTKIDELGRGG